MYSRFTVLKLFPYVYVNTGGKPRNYNKIVLI